MFFFQKAKMMDQAQAKKMLDEDPSIALIDVREEYEFEAGFIKGAVNVPLQHIPYIFTNLYKDKNQKIFVYCRTGNRSESALKMLTAMGYTDVHNIGGVTTWPYGLVTK